LGYFVNLGPYAAILLNHKITDNYQGEIPETKDGIKNVEWGMSTGLGINYKLNEKLKLETADIKQLK